MRQIISAIAVSWVIASAACAQPLPLDRDVGPAADEGTVACKTEDAMVTLMKATPPSSPALNRTVLSQLIKRGDCLLMPHGWAVLEVKNPPADQREDHAAALTLRTPQGIMHMWGAPFISE